MAKLGCGHKSNRNDRQPLFYVPGGGTMCFTCVLDGADQLDELRTTLGGSLNGITSKPHKPVTGMDMPAGKGRARPAHRKPKLARKTGRGGKKWTPEQRRKFTATMAEKRKAAE